MGMTYKRAIIRQGRKSKASRQVSFLIDSGAFHSLVPSKILRELRVEPYRSVDIVLADGSEITRAVGDLFFDLDGHSGMAPVIFGLEGEEPLLGATTLESLGLVLNPLRRELYPIQLRHF